MTGGWGSAYQTWQAQGQQDPSMHYLQSSLFSLSVMEEAKNGVSFPKITCDSVVMDSDRMIKSAALSVCGRESCETKVPFLICVSCAFLALKWLSRVHKGA